jgi:hypothetical protein
MSPNGPRVTPDGRHTHHRVPRRMTPITGGGLRVEVLLRMFGSAYEPLLAEDDPDHDTQCGVLIVEVQEWVRHHSSATDLEQEVAM